MSVIQMHVPHIHVDQCAMFPRKNTRVSFHLIGVVRVRILHNFELLAAIFLIFNSNVLLHPVKKH